MLRGSPRFQFVHRALAGRPRTLIAIVAVLAMLVFAAGGWAVWFSYELTAGLPDRAALKAIGDMLGGYGSCGRPLCCTTFLQTFEPISIKMAKQQNLSLNPSKLSGMDDAAVVGRRFLAESRVPLGDGDGQSCGGEFSSGGQPGDAAADYQGVN